MVSPSTIRWTVPVSQDWIESQGEVRTLAEAGKEIAAASSAKSATTAAVALLLIPMVGTV